MVITFGLDMTKARLWSIEVEDDAGMSQGFDNTEIGDQCAVGL